LAQGEYISPERLENIYITHPAIATIFVHGDSTQTSLVAIIGSDPDPFAAWATKVLRRPISTAEISSVYQDPKIQRTLLKELDQLAQRRKLQGFEKIRGIHIASDPFTVENELLTPTMKLKRSDAAKAFRKEIDELYKNVESRQIKAKL
jgi:long-chain acyl-CoA synthetase